MSKADKDRAFVITVENAHRLKWHKFLIYFSLWFSAVVSFTDGIAFLTGYNYGDQQEAIYQAFNKLRTYDTVYGVFFLLLAAFMIFTRFRLARLKKSGIGYLCLCIILSPIGEIVYRRTFNASYGEIVGGGMDYLQPAVSLVVSIVFLFINLFYYAKREELFE